MIFALVTNYGTKAKTVVELSLSKFFKRKYSTLSRAISGYFTSTNNNTNRDELRSSTRNDIKGFLLESVLEGEKSIHSFAIDITANIKKYLVKRHRTEATYTFK